MDVIPDGEGRRARKRRQMLEHLSGTAARLFETLGYDPVTMEQIAAEADVAKRTLYNHFPTKEALLAYWIDAQLERDLARLRKDVAKRRTFLSRIACMLDASAQWCEEHPTYLMAYLKHRFLTIDAPRPHDATERRDIAEVWRQLIVQGQQAGELRKQLSADQLATSFHHLYLGALLRWLNVPGLSLRREFRGITSLFLQGAAATGARAPGRASRAGPRNTGGQTGRSEADDR
ncbi:TetR/AcrR family transcriptional regulator [Bordetella flabilis]|uniref:TetR family transcriptional regulator n=1 Tax=Bordetella flabilis TaxID=463014 RepID=A0A193GFZ0_9BORD|nr:TetR/AcrR family transcriptional regulator [Bordetella flabilis]ANN78361.1 TetR family transcriptional regulator [Bordetella flabilis]